MSERKKYNYMENTLLAVIKRTISLDEKQVKANNVILNGMLNQVIANAKENQLFNLLYQRNFHGGSYYDGLKIEQSEEYDMDLVMVFPKTCTVELAVVQEMPGFVSARISNATPELKTILDGEYLNPHKVLTWMEMVFTKAIQQFPLNGSQYVITINETEYMMRICKSGPAFTVKVNNNMEKLDVDLVPCFVFDESHWPKAPFRINPSNDKKTFFIVPQIPKGLAPEQTNRSWRLSFQEQERDLIKGAKNLKPAVKLLKKMRDILGQKNVSSYFIKTIFLWHVVQKEAAYWENSLSFVFMEMLGVYIQCLADGKILYYWNDRNNLIANIDAIVLDNYSNRLKNLLAKINASEDPTTVAKLFLRKPEIDELITEGVIKPAEETPPAPEKRQSASPPKQDDYTMILNKLTALHEESKAVHKSLGELREDNKTLLGMMLAMTDKLGVLESKCSYLEQQFNRAK